MSGSDEFLQEIQKTARRFVQMENERRERARVKADLEKAVVAARSARSAAIAAAKESRSVVGDASPAGEGFVSEEVPDSGKRDVDLGDEDELIVEKSPELGMRGNDRVVLVTLGRDVVLHLGRGLRYRVVNGLGVVSVHVDVPSVDAHGPESRDASDSIVGAASGAGTSAAPDASSGGDGMSIWENASKLAASLTGTRRERRELMRLQALIAEGGS